jgi:ribosomal protein S15P/S13E
VNAVETPCLTIREAAANLLERIAILRGAFAAHPKDLEIEKRGLATTDVLAYLDRDAERCRTNCTELLQAATLAVRALPTPGHYGYETVVGDALREFYDAVTSLDMALKSERSLEGGAE